MIRQVTKEIFHEIMSGNEFDSYYQPIVSVGRGRIIGVESLLRAAYHGEAVSPEEMFSLARQENQLYELDRGCQMHAVQNYKGQGENLLFINMDASLLETYLKNLEELLRKLDLFGIPRKIIVVEISEKISQDDQLLSTIAEECRKAGFLVALDDVGSEHSNLYRIIRVEPDIIKIDRSVISGVQENHVKQEVVRAICEMGQRIGAITIAEGTETQDEVLMCMTCGVDWFQGFYFDKAMRPDLIGKQTYLLKCRELSMLYRQRENKKMQSASREISQMKATFRAFRTRFIKADQNEMACIMQSFAVSCESIECIYILDEEGMQLSETIFHPKVLERSRKIVSAMKKGDCHISKEYYMVVRNRNKIYVSSAYISQNTGNLCRTVSASCQINSQVMIICIEFMQKNS